MLSGSPIILIVLPACNCILSFSAMVVRTSGPLVSINRAISLLTERTLLIIFINPSLLRCAEFIRTTFIPDSNNSRIKSGSHLLSLMVAIIFVNFGILKKLNKKLKFNQLSNLPTKAVWLPQPVGRNSARIR